MCREDIQYVQDIFTIRPIAIKYRNGTAASALFRGGRGGAALWARVAPVARGTTGLVPPDSGFGRRARLQAFRSPATRREVESSGQAFSGGCKAYPSRGKRRRCACRSRGTRSLRNTARRVHREFVLARCRSGFLPALPGAATRRGIATSAGFEFGTVGRDTLR